MPMPLKEERDVLTVQLPPNERAVLVAMASKGERSLAAEARLALRSHIAKAGR